MTQELRKEDISDLDIADASELGSDGSAAFLSAVTVVSTSAATKTIVVSGVYLINVPENRVEANDKVTLTGTAPGGAADGTYTVASVTGDTTLVVSETIADSTGGTAEFIHKAGALRIGVDSSNFLYSSQGTVQEVLADLDSAIDTGGSADWHKSVRQLIHFVETNSPGDGFGDGPLYCETLPSGDPFPTSETWYETSAKLKKICRQEVTYNSNKTFATEKWIVYKSDGTNPAADAVDTISYSGLFETSRSRAITVYG